MRRPPLSALSRAAVMGAAAAALSMPSGGRPAAAASSPSLVVLREQVLDMSVLPELAAEPWDRLGTAPALSMGDGTLLLNDNTRNDRVGYQTLLGELQADHRITLSARVKVLSNLEGRAVTLEVSRPRLQAVLRLYPQRLELMERVDTNRWRWLGAALVDLEDFQVVEITKLSRREDPREHVVVRVNDREVLRAVPHGDAPWEVGRLVLGSVANAAVGASVWDWVRYRVEEVPPPPPPHSIGFFKARSSPVP